MISKEEIENLARLARLKLSDEEVVAFQTDFESILGYVGQVAAVSGNMEDKEHSRPLLHNVMRDDVPYADDCAVSGKQTAILAQLPHRDGDFALVRKIIHKDL